MSTECDRAARERALPTRIGPTPLFARTEFITRTIASSSGRGANPAEDLSGCGVMAFAPARVLAAASTSANRRITTLRIRHFPDIRGVSAAD
jgi:hypothetical protein